MVIILYICSHFKYGAMKRFFLLTALILLGLTLSAQTQQGYVKTKGRMVNGKLVPGQGLKGATVSIKGRTTVLVKADDGSFSFPVSEAQFRVDSVRKKGYQMVDMDAIGKTYKPSPNPLYLVMETPEQQLQDQLAAERKIRRTLTNQLHQKEDEIERLKEQQKISEEEYRQALQKLYKETGQNEQLVKDMVERYSTIDFDQLDEFGQKISELILDGKLSEADSLINAKGDINERATQYHIHKAANDKEKEYLSQRLEQWGHRDSLAKKELEDVANDCYMKYEICKMQHLFDSAGYYIELRSQLDSSNFEWQNEAGRFFRQYLSAFEKARSFFQLIIQINNKCNKETFWDISANTDIGYIYYCQGDFDNAKKHYEKALNNATNLSGFDQKPSYAVLLEHLGAIYNATGDFSKALDCDRQALDIRIKNYGIVHPNVALSYDNIGLCYYYLGDYLSALKYIQKAEDVQIETLDSNNIVLSTTYNNFGLIYSQLSDYKKAIAYYEKAKNIVVAEYGERHPDVAMELLNIGTDYLSLGDYSKGLKYLFDALDIYQTTLGNDHHRVATNYSDIGIAYDNLGEYKQAIDYFQKALVIQKSKLGESHPDVANTYCNIAVCYQHQSAFNKAKEYFNLALDIDIESLGKDHPNTAKIYQNLGMLYLLEIDFKKAVEYEKKALKTYKKTYQEKHLSIASVYRNLGLIHYSRGICPFCDNRLSQFFLDAYGLNGDDFKKALDYYGEALEIAQSTLGENNVFVATLYSDIGEVFKAKEDYGQALNYFQKAISILDKTIGLSHPRAAIVYEYMGATFEAQQEYQKAIEYYQQSMTIQESALGVEHPDTIKDREKIAELEAKLKAQEN